MNWALETRSQVQSMHSCRGYYIYYSLWTEPWKPGLKFNPCICKDISYSCLMILSQSFQGLCMFSNICTLKQILMAENMLAAWYVHYVNCKTCRTLPSSAQRTTHVADKQDSGDILYYITVTEPWKPGLKFKKKAMIMHFLFLRRSCLFLLFFVDALPPPSSNLALTYYHHKCTKSKQNSYNHFFEFHTWILENVQVVKHMWSNDLLIQNTSKHWLWFCFKAYEIAAPVN